MKPQGKFAAFNTADSSPAQSPKKPQAELIKLDPKELEEEFVKDKLIGNFTEHMSAGVFDAAIYRRYIGEGVDAGVLLGYLLNRLFDKSEEEIRLFLPYFSKLVEANVFDGASIAKGFASFFQVLPDIESDFPHMPKLLSELLFTVFVRDQIADFAQARFGELPQKPEELEAFMGDIFVKVAGVFT